MSKKGLAVLSSAALAAVMAAAISTNVYAANGDFHDKKTGKIYKNAEYLENDKLMDELIDVSTERPGDFVYEFKNKGYNYEKMFKTYTESKKSGKTVIESFKASQVKENEEKIPVVINEVKAIPQTIKKGEIVDLTFLVNGEKLTKAEFDKKYEGYKVEFLFNKDWSKNEDNKDAKATGKVKVEDGFKYAVQITDTKDKKLPEKVEPSIFADVAVEDATEAVKVAELGLKANDKEYKLNYVTLNNGNKVKIEATKALNAFGKEVKAEKLPKVEKVVSSNPTIAYYDGNIVARKEGKVTFDVTFVGIKETYKLDVEVKDTQEATSIKAEDMKIQAKAISIKDIKDNFVVLDQYGQELRGDKKIEPVVKVVNEKGEQKEVKEEKVDLSIEGVYTVEVSTTKEGKEIKLGSFKVETVKVNENNIDNYKIVTKDGKELVLDLNPDIKNAEGEKLNKKSDVLNIEGFVKGVKVDKVNLKGFEVISSDKDIIDVKLQDDKVTVDAKKAGNVTISLVKVEGDLKTVVAKFDVKVQNTTELVNKLTLKADTKVEIKMNNDGKDIKADEEALKLAVKNATIEGEKDAEFTNKIAKVEAIKNNKVVIVKMTETYGGKEFVLDAKLVADMTAIKPAKPDVEENTDAKKVQEAKVKLNEVKWNKDLETTIKDAEKAITDAKLQEGVKAEAAEGTEANKGKVVITITSGEAKDTIVIAQ